MKKLYLFSFVLVPLLLLSISVNILSVSAKPLEFESREGSSSSSSSSSSEEDYDEDEKFFTRIDDMIFRSKQVKAGLSSNNFRWPDGVIPYKVQSRLPDELHEMLEEAMTLLETHTCIQFTEKTSSEKNYVYISYKEKGCFSHVGMVKRGRQKLNLGSGCWRFGTIIHELIHTIGFSHEHQRNDRDEYIKIAYDKVEEGKEHNFKLDREMGLEFSTYDLPYNFASVMHYGRMAFSDENDEPTIIPKKISELSSKNVIYSRVDDEGRPVIGLRKLTWGDVKMINLMYKNVCQTEKNIKKSINFFTIYFYKSNI